MWLAASAIRMHHQSLIPSVSWVFLSHIHFNPHYLSARTTASILGEVLRGYAIAWLEGCQALSSSRVTALTRKGNWGMGIHRRRKSIALFILIKIAQR